MDHTIDCAWSNTIDREWSSSAKARRRLVCYDESAHVAVHAKPRRAIHTCTARAETAQFMRLRHKRDGLEAVSDLASSHQTRAQSQNRHRRWLAGDHRADLFVRLVDQAAFVAAPCGTVLKRHRIGRCGNKQPIALTCPPEA